LTFVVSISDKSKQTGYCSPKDRIKSISKNLLASLNSKVSEKKSTRHCQQSSLRNGKVTWDFLATPKKLLAKITNITNFCQCFQFWTYLPKDLIQFEAAL